MSDKQVEDQKPQTMPSINRTREKKWVIRKLASGTKPKEAAISFLEIFPRYDLDIYGDYDHRVRIVTGRFHEYNSNPKLVFNKEITKLRESDKIRDAKKSLHEVYELTDPIERIHWLQEIFFSDEDLSVSEKVKILSEIGKLSDRMIGDELDRHFGKSTYGGADMKGTPTDTPFGRIGRGEA